MTVDFVPTELLRINRIEGKVPGVEKGNVCKLTDVSISRNPGLWVLRRHPSLNNNFFIGSDEGCIYNCSVQNIGRYLDSFIAHDGPIYCLEFSPFCDKVHKSFLQIKVILGRYLFPIFFPTLNAIYFYASLYFFSDFLDMRCRLVHKNLDRRH